MVDRDGARRRGVGLAREANADRGRCLAGECGGTYGRELFDARPVNVRPTLLGTAERGGGVDVDQILGRRPPEERVQYGHDIGPRRRAPVFPALKEAPEIVLSESA